MNRFRFSFSNLLLAMVPLAIGFGLIREYFRTGRLDNLLVAGVLVALVSASVGLGWLMDRARWAERAKFIGVIGFCLVGIGGAIAMLLITMGWWLLR
jgi:hypothetical protein